MTIAKDKVISIDYTLKDDDGNVLDTSEGRAPLQYLQGHSNIIIGLEEALEGKNVGENVLVSIPPEKGYGTHNPNLVQKVPKTAFPDPENIEAGTQFRVNNPEAGLMIVKVVEVETETVTIDGNHELAGQTLHFTVDVREVRDATDDEIAHGHVHGPGGHQH